MESAGMEPEVSKTRNDGVNYQPRGERENEVDPGLILVPYWPSQ